jgi:hypothetical protein
MLIIYYRLIYISNRLYKKGGFNGQRTANKFKSRLDGRAR